MVRAFSGLTDDLRQRFRSEVLSVDPEGIQEAARRFFPQAKAVIAVCAPEERLAKANETLTEKMILEKLAG
jgi:Zn-dependent M16 (insulinase) family peptidase